MRGKHILVLETNGDDAFLLARALSSIPSCTSYICRSLAEAQAYLSKSGVYHDTENFPAPSCVITELRLGLNTAFDLLHWLREHETLRALPIYILTDAISPQENHLLKTLGVSGIFEKPASTQDLKATLVAIAEKVCRVN